MGYADEVLADSPLSYYRLDETSGNFADLSGNGRGAGAFGTAMTYSQPPLISTGTSVLNSVNGRAEWGGGYYLPGATVFTLEAWIKTTSASSLRGIIEMGANAPELDIDSDGKLVVYRSFATEEGKSTISVNDGLVHHVVVTANGIGTTKIYVDGVDRTGTMAGVTFGGNTNNTGFGARWLASASSPAADSYFIGYLDEIAIYGTALSEARILTHFLVGVGGYPAEIIVDNPAFYWRLNELSGTVANDTSVNNRDGTLSATGITYSQTGALATDPSDNGLLFDGSIGSLQTATAIDLNPAGVVTVEFWLNVAAWNNTDDLACEFSADYNTNTGSFIVDPCNAAGDFVVAMKTASGTNAISFARPSTNMFHHYVFVFKENTQTNAIVAYIDGLPWDGTRTETGATSPNLGNYVMYFMSRAASSLFLAGTLDEVAVYQSELSDIRILSHYQAATAVTGPDNFFGPHLLTNSAGTVYLAPSKGARIYTIHVSNPSASPVDFTLSLGADAAGTRLWDGYSIPADTVIERQMYLTLNAGEIIQAFASTAGVLILTIDGKNL